MERAFPVKISNVPVPTLPRPIRPTPTSMHSIPHSLSGPSSVAYDSNRMSRTRRHALLTLLLSPALGAQEQFPADQRRPDPFPKVPEEDRKLPNGKSQKDEIAKQNH